MVVFFRFWIVVAIVGAIFFLADLFCRFLVKYVVFKRLPGIIKKIDDEKLKRIYLKMDYFSGSLGYVIGFFFTGPFIFSVMRIVKAAFKCIEEEMIERDLLI